MEISLPALFLLQPELSGLGERQLQTPLGLICEVSHDLPNYRREMGVQPIRRLDLAWIGKRRAWL